MAVLLFCGRNNNGSPVEDFSQSPCSTPSFSPDWKPEIPYTTPVPPLMLDSYGWYFVLVQLMLG